MATKNAQTPPKPLPIAGFVQATHCCVLEA